MLYEPPYGPEELKEPPLEGDKFLALLDSEKARSQSEPPPLYQDLAAGKLHRDDLHLWVKDMYSYWDHALVFSTGAIFVKTNDEATRTHILRKLVDLEGEDTVKDLTGWTTPAYEELWLRFGEGLGLSRREIVDWKPFTRSYYAQTTLCTLSRWWEWSWLDGVASLLAGDLHGQEYLGRAHEALQRHYDVPVQAKRDSAESDTDGGTSAPFVAQVVFGSGLIARCSAPPRRSASSPNHARFSGSPLSDADWTYLPASDAPGASTVKRPWSRAIDARSKTGEPTM